MKNIYNYAFSVIPEHPQDAKDDIQRIVEKYDDLESMIRVASRNLPMPTFTYMIYFIIKECNIDIIDILKEIPDYLFCGATLDSLTINTPISELNVDGFRPDTVIKDLTIPKSVKRIIPAKYLQTASFDNVFYMGSMEEYSQTNISQLEELYNANISILG